MGITTIRKPIWQLLHRAELVLKVLTPCTPMNSICRMPGGPTYISTRIRSRKVNSRQPLPARAETAHTVNNRCHSYQ
jgi:hypothetical protein